jgi:hypothetical protein
MTYIFQAKPERYDLRTRLMVGKEVGWIASRYRNQMRTGDIVYYWSAGDRDIRGLYGWGTITSEGAFVDSRGTYRILVTCKKIFPRHINYSVIREYPILSDMQLLVSPMGTNFLLTVEESEALSTLIEATFGSEWIPDENG